VSLAHFRPKLCQVVGWFTSNRCNFLLIGLLFSVDVAVAIPINWVLIFLLVAALRRASARN
jgi:hypothetical protein